MKKKIIKNMEDEYGTYHPQWGHYELESEPFSHMIVINKNKKLTRKEILEQIYEHMNEDNIDDETAFLRHLIMKWTKKQFKCNNYGLNCLKCPYWNYYTNFCTKYKIYSETHER